MNLFELYQQAIKINGKNKVVSALNITTGTAARWEQKQNVPSQYQFDLIKLCGKEIDYSLFTPREKDQFYTPAETAEKVVNIFTEKLSSLGFSLENYVFVEPSAGNGAFLSYLPLSTISMDIEPADSKIEKIDFFDFLPEPNKNYIVIGNPPFGLRGQKALKFINRALEFADFCAFILPPLFDSDGRGTPKKRVNGNLIYSGPCQNSYYYPNGVPVKVNTIFQIWTRLNLPSISDSTENPNGFLVYSVSDGGTPSSTRNKDKIGHCDFYLPSTVFGAEKMRAYFTFEDLPQRRGYGIVILDKSLTGASTLPWDKIAFQSTNGAYNLRTSYIIKSINLLQENNNQ